MNCTYESSKNQKVSGAFINASSINKVRVSKVRYEVIIIGQVRLKEVGPTPKPKATEVSRDETCSSYVGAFPRDVGLGALVLVPGMHLDKNGDKTE